MILLTVLAFASLLLIVLAIVQAKTSSKKLTAFFLAIGIACLLFSAGNIYLKKTNTNIDLSVTYDVSVTKTK